MTGGKTTRIEYGYRRRCSVKEFDRRAAVMTAIEVKVVGRGKSRAPWIRRKLWIGVGKPHERAVLDL